MVKEKELIKLQATTPKSERKYRVGNTFDFNGKKLANMLCYIDARYVMDTLDKIVGVGNWDNEYFEIKRNLFCKITIRFEKEDGTIGQVSKMDCGTESNVEKQKGESSDAFKRCAVQFGVARDLYSSPNYRVEMNEYKGKLYPPKDWKPSVGSK